MQGKRSPDAFSHSVLEAVGSTVVAPFCFQLLYSLCHGSSSSIFWAAPALCSQVVLGISNSQKFFFGPQFWHDRLPADSKIWMFHSSLCLPFQQFQHRILKIHITRILKHETDLRQNQNQDLKQNHHKSVSFSPNVDFSVLCQARSFYMVRKMTVVQHKSLSLRFIIQTQKRFFSRNPV